MATNPIDIYREPKNNQKSIELRKKGNALYSNQPLKVIAVYNQSICFADETSENYTLCYANRSATFFRLHLFNECLADVWLENRLVIQTGSTTIYKIVKVPVIHV